MILPFTLPNIPHVFTHDSSRLLCPYIISNMFSWSFCLPHPDWVILLPNMSFFFNLLLHTSTYTYLLTVPSSTHYNFSKPPHYPFIHIRLLQNTSQSIHPHTYCFHTPHDPFLDALLLHQTEFIYRHTYYSRAPHNPLIPTLLLQHNSKFIHI